MQSFFEILFYQIKEIAFFFVKSDFFNILDFESISCVKFSLFVILFYDCAFFGKNSPYYSSNYNFTIFRDLDHNLHKKD